VDRHIAVEEARILLAAEHHIGVRRTAVEAGLRSLVAADIGLVEDIRLGEGIVLEAVHHSLAVEELRTEAVVVGSRPVEEGIGLVEDTDCSPRGPRMVVVRKT
jgi:hypothetical protein